LGKEAREVVCRELDRALRESDYWNVVKNYYDYMYGVSRGVGAESGGHVKGLHQGKCRWGYVSQLLSTPGRRDGCLAS